MIDVHEIDHALLHRHMGGIPRRAGSYYQTTPHATTTTNGALGVGTGRFSPWAVRRTISIVRLGAEVSTAGEAGSLVRLGIYADDGTGYPGALVLDAGTIAGDSATVQEITVSTVLTPGLYWVGAVVQNVVTTQPHLRAIAVDLSSEMPLTTSGATPTTNWTPGVGFTGFSMTGALPASWPTATPNVTSVAARLFVKTA